MFVILIRNCVLVFLVLKMKLNKPRAKLQTCFILKQSYTHCPFFGLSALEWTEYKPNWSVQTVHALYSHWVLVTLAQPLGNVRSFSPTDNCDCLDFDLPRNTPHRWRERERRARFHRLQKASAQLWSKYFLSGLMCASWHACVSIRMWMQHVNVSLQRVFL